MLGRLHSAESSLNLGQGASVLLSAVWHSLPGSVAVVSGCEAAGGSDWDGGGASRPRFISRHPSAGILFAFPL